MAEAPGTEVPEESKRVERLPPQAPSGLTRRE